MKVYTCTLGPGQTVSKNLTGGVELGGDGSKGFSTASGDEEASDGERGRTMTNAIMAHVGQTQCCGSVVSRRANDIEPRIRRGRCRFL
eukprot:535331-Pleurochrysis_carterae.AAC.1